ncbi:MAG: sugar transferase [Anaerolineae bacterium]|nr:sugar transferase [Anaerolineae bacterium]
MTQATYQLANPLPVAVNARWAERLLLVIVLTCVDLVMVLAGFWLAYNIRFEIGITWFYQHEVPPTDFYKILVFLIAPGWLVVFRLFGLYDFKNLFGGTREYAQAFNASTFCMMLMILFIFFGETREIARAWVILSWLLVSVGVMSGRFLLRRIVQNLRANGRFLTAALIIGANEEGLAIAEQLQANPKAGVWLAGFADDELGPGSELLPNVPVLGSVDAIGLLVRQHGIQEIIVASTALPREKLLQLFTAFGSEDNITIRMSSGLYELLTTGVEVQEFGNVPLLSVNKVRLTGADVIMKTLLDTFLSLGALLVFLPVMVAMAIAVRLDSPGPIFHLRRVVGVGGKAFNALKFRTMYVDADERLARDPELRREFELNHKLKNDPRVTRIGRFLRRTSLDELPQLINVLFGQMSLVGPRMITAEERARYGKWRMNLSTVKPGITGLWQVSGRSDVSYEERVMLDMNYIRNYSIWFDLQILWQTIPAVLKSRGAY